ncbi:hypothetical protein RO3G_00659 [Rhizopus delemar RA 99-880]|uniref:Uncharacterized protein n=1 Tax=Rhizopus delemar (strain RA 99-880 / ATCC MYA-4621 / FGSC 9543 / NRRL 43880) TaxID=246409 RepID=I1BIC5_RHIO9|nr:hypothetical protein RO3G_00659 [Rhizopus delemar RA 99-880]|eukprot:EIE75955.1 hypothetical protein RO3G_00659 [Rhizopus delemar RA 99-880]
MFLSRKERANDIATDKPIYMVTENVGNNNYLPSGSYHGQFELYKHIFFVSSVKMISYTARKVDFSNSLNEEEVTVHLSDNNNLQS